MAKRHLDEVDNYDYLASNSNLPEVVVTAKSPYSYWDGFDWYTATDTGKRKKMGVDFNPNGTHIITDPKQFEQVRLVNAAKKDINRTHEFGEMVRGLATDLAMLPAGDIFAEGISNGIRGAKYLYNRSLMNGGKKDVISYFTSPTYKQRLVSRMQNLDKSLTPKEANDYADRTIQGMIDNINEHKYRLVDRLGNETFGLRDPNTKEIFISSKTPNIRKSAIHETIHASDNDLTTFLNEDLNINPNSKAASYYGDEGNLITDTDWLNYIGKSKELRARTLNSIISGKDGLDWEQLSRYYTKENVNKALNNIVSGAGLLYGVNEFNKNRLREIPTFRDGGQIGRTNNRKQDKPQIEWMRNWLSSRRDILQKNAEETTWDYYKYKPVNNTGDVRDAGWNVRSYSNEWNPFTYFNNSNPIRNRVNKLIYAQVENADDTPKQEIGNGSSYNYDLRGVYVEPDWNNKGNYIAFAGQNIAPEVKVHEFTHASHPIQQERYIEDVIFKNRDIPNVTINAKNKKDNAKELYGALQEFRYKNGLSPTQIITQEYLDNHRDLFYGNYLEKISDEDKLRLFNDVAINNSLKKSLFTNLASNGGRISLKSGGTIYIKPENRGKFNATKERTGKTTEELTHSKNPLTRKRAIFAQNAAKWKH